MVDVVLSTATPAPGSTFTATLTGCTAGEIVQFSVAETGATVPCAGTSATASLTAPSAPGSYAVSAVAGASGVRDAAQLVVAGVVDDALAPSVPAVAPGGRFSVSLFGCLVGEEVLFTVEGDSATAICVEVPGGGGFGMARQVPSGRNTVATAELIAPTAPGRYTVEAVALTSGLRDTAIITVEALTVGISPAAPAQPQTIPVTR